MPNLIYQNEATAITWLASGGTNALTLTSLAAGAGRQGAHYDFGAGARARDYTWRAWYIPGTTPVVGELMRVYWKTSDGTYHDNDDGIGDIAVSAENKLKNLEYLGAIVVDEAATVRMVKSGFLPKELCAHRYGAPVFWNGTADAFSSTAADHGFKITPVPDEVQ